MLIVISTSLFIPLDYQLAHFKLNKTKYNLNFFRGISSVVRRCFHKATGKPYAVKIIDKLSDAGGVDIETTTRDEVNILLALQGHRNISK